MPILSAKGLRRAYGTREVLVDVGLSIEAGERIGLVGLNGSGKTTLARILAGTEDPDGGDVVRASGLRVEHLEQEPRFEAGASALEAVLSGLARWQAAVARHQIISERIERGEGDLHALSNEQAEVAALVEQLGGWEKQHEALAMLDHVGIEDSRAEVASMSGGERRRVALARLLIAEPDLAVLDEPTNHLDIDAIEWLERWLADRFRGALLLVTHDRYLLDRVVGRTLELEGGKVHAYAGGWASYLAAKAERTAHAERAEANRRNFLRRELEWLRRSPQARSTKQKARIDRVESAMGVTAPVAERAARIELGHAQAGRTVLDAENITVEVAGRRLVQGLSLGLTKGERVGVIGPNGCGKTSLLRVLTGQTAPAAGRLTLAKNTRIAYLDQMRSGLDDAQTIHDAVAEGRARIRLGDTEMDVRSYLDRFLFSAHEQRQRVGLLSGGERARVALARTLRDGANLVVLDEPTNDLDASTLGALEESLLEYPGTVIVVTHDRALLDRIATSILVFDHGAVTRYEGGYADYLSLRPPARGEARSELSATPKSPTRPTSRKRADKLTYAERLELDGLLDRVDVAEQSVQALESELARPEFYGLPESERRERFGQLDRAREHAAELAERWADLESRRGAD